MSNFAKPANRPDPFYRKAKGSSFAARAVYKLEEVDKKHHLIGPRQRVLDLGCRPGSWLQYCARIVGPGGVLVGIDREALEVAIPPPGARIVVGDVFTVSIEEL